MPAARALPFLLVSEFDGATLIAPFAKRKAGLSSDEAAQVRSVVQLLRGLPPLGRTAWINPEDGTRVQTKADGSIEFMASLDELKAMLIGIEPKLASVLPTNMRNKPRETQLRWRIRNEFRKGKRGTK